METALKNDVIYITGSSAGIGFETAKLCLQNKATVVITGRNNENLEKAKNELLKISNQVIAHNIDVSNESDVMDSLGSSWFLAIFLRFFVEECFWINWLINFSYPSGIVSLNNSPPVLLVIWSRKYIESLLWSGSAIPSICQPLLLNLFVNGAV